MNTSAAIAGRDIGTPERKQVCYLAKPTAATGLSQPQLLPFKCTDIEMEVAVSKSVHFRGNYQPYLRNAYLQALQDGDFFFHLSAPIYSAAIATQVARLGAKGSPETGNCHVGSQAWREGWP